MGKTRIRLVEEEAAGEENDILLRTPRIGETLVARGAITQDQLRIALHEQKTARGEMLGAILLRLGFLDQDALALFLAERAGVKPVDLSRHLFDKALMREMPKEAALKALALPLARKGRKLEVAMADPFDIVAMDEVRRYFPGSIEIIPRVAGRATIEAKIESCYGSEPQIDFILRELEGNRARAATEVEHPVVRLVYAILHDAVLGGASDIHFEPESHFVRIRLRLDGVLRQTQALHLSHWPALSHRLKIMAGMDIADTRSVQDGRFRMRVGEAEVDFRAAIMPSVWGETIVVRVLDHTRSLVPLEKLGYGPKALERLDLVAHKPQGVTLFTGPTGSGKSTTLYALLKKLSTPEMHVATLEEPVEFQLDLIRQTSIHDARNLDFASGVRGLLRMDPDIIFIGEIRDGETARMALRASMTGHQVFSTLHCNDALGALPRLVDLGLNPALLVGNMNGLVAQRLVRTLCPHCKRQRHANEKECALLRTDPSRPPFIADPEGCENCAHSGRKGRTVIAEILPVSQKIDDLIAARAPRRDLMRAARDEGFTSLQEDGIARVLNMDVALEDLCRIADLSRGDGA